MLLGAAAPAFAAAAAGGCVVATLPVGNLIVVIAETQVEAGSPAVGREIAWLEDGIEGRALILGGDGRHRHPTPDTRLAPGQHLLIVATRAGLPEALGRVGA